MSFEEQAHALLYPPAYDGSTQHERIAKALREQFCAGLRFAVGVACKVANTIDENPRHGGAMQVVDGLIREASATTKETVK